MAFGFHFAISLCRYRFSCDCFGFSCARNNWISTLFEVFQWMGIFHLQHSDTSWVVTTVLALCLIDTEICCAQLPEWSPCFSSTGWFSRLYETQRLFLQSLYSLIFLFILFVNWVCMCFFFNPSFVCFLFRFYKKNSSINETFISLFLRHFCRLFELGQLFTCFFFSSIKWEETKKNEMNKKLYKRKETKKKCV